MSAQTKGVDVLAVMDRALSACEAHTARTVYIGGAEGFRRITDNYGLPEARAAVAELIEALDDVIGWVPGPAAFHTDVPAKAVARARKALKQARGGA